MSSENNDDDHDDELDDLQHQARHLTALEYKKQALLAKQAGNVAQALQWLKQSKAIEAMNVQHGVVMDNIDDDAENDTNNSLLLPSLYWKKLALLYKQAGHVERAKQALLRCKQVEQQEQEQKEQEQQDEQQNDVAGNPNNDGMATAAAAAEDAIGGNSNEGVTTSAQIENADGDDNDKEDNDVNDEDEAILKALQQQQQQSGNTVSTEATNTIYAEELEAIASNNNINAEEASSKSLAFTLDEMMDYEMMMEFQANGMPVPTQEDFATRILQCKKAALQLKQQQQIPQATQQLRQAKQLEKVQMALLQQQQNGGTNHDNDNNDADGAWMASLNPEESALLGELMHTERSGDLDAGKMDDDDADLLSLQENNDASATALLEGQTSITASSSTTLTAEEMESMDDNDLLDFIEMMGRSSLPSIESLENEATRQQQLAIGHKQTGRLDAAKMALLKSKRIKMQADRLTRILQRLDSQKGGDSSTASSTGQDVNIDDLEALLEDGKKSTAPKAAQKKVEPPTAVLANPWLSKPSGEIKAEVLRLKNARQVQEATALLQILKQVVQKEKEAAEAEKCQQMIQMLQEQFQVSETQIRLWQYYSWFVEPESGVVQHQAWTEYATSCQRAIQGIQSSGSLAVTITPLADTATSPLQILQDDVVEMMERGMNAAADREKDPCRLDNELEVAVLDFLNMNENEKLQKIVKKQKKSDGNSSSCPFLRIDAKVQLPLRSEDPSQPIHLDLRPIASSVAEDGSLEYQFDSKSEFSKQRLELPKKDSKEAKTLVRRMGTKSIQFSIYQTNKDTTKDQKTGKSWLFGRRKPEEPKEEDEKDALLGKVTLALSPLLMRNCIAEDIPLCMNNHEVGGCVRVAIRTFPALTEDYKGADDKQIANSERYEKTLELIFANNDK